jgi:hypothetical protein
MKAVLLSVLMVSMLSVFCFAQDPAASPAPAAPIVSVAPLAPVVAPAPVQSPSLNKVSDVVNKIPNVTPGWIIAILAFLAELVLRFYPSVKPKSLLLYAASMLSLIGLGLSKISSLLDNVAQNVKDPA